MPVYTCTICGATFSDYRSLDAHKKTKHPEKYVSPFYAPPTAAPAVPEAKETYVPPESKPTDTLKLPEYTCPYCGAKFSDYRTMVAHIDRNHPPKPYVCPYCGAEFATLEEYESHRDAKHRFICPVCAIVFVTKEELEAHMSKAHPPPPPPPAVPEWTHKLVVGFMRMPWATQAGVMAVFDTMIIPIINSFEWLVGYDFISKTMDWEGLKVTLFYRARGSPVITAAVLGVALLKIAALAIGLMLAAGFLIIALAWYERERTVASKEQTLEQLLEEKLITPEQYAEWTKEAEKPPEWGWIAAGVIGAALLWREKKRREAKPE